MDARVLPTLQFALEDAKASGVYAAQAGHCGHVRRF